MIIPTTSVRKGVSHNCGDIGQDRTQGSLCSVIVIMQNICNLIGWNSMHIFDIFNYHHANITGMWNAEMLGGIYKTFELTTLT